MGIRRAYTTLKKDIILDLLSQVGSVVKQLTGGGKGKEDEDKSTQSELLAGLKDTKKKKNPFNLIDLEAVKTKLLFGDTDLIKKFNVKKEKVDDKLQIEDKSSTPTISTPTDKSPRSSLSGTRESKKEKKVKEKKDRLSFVKKGNTDKKEKEKVEESNSLEVDALVDSLLPSPNPKLIPRKDKALTHKRAFSLQVPPASKK